ncbi:hypothetical protein [Micromonospora chalcea]|uniref:hypothetical protein n=1 Tax=Micromonospora chalcea TaxID=1874 RepID=UPI0038F74970
MPKPHRERPGRLAAVPDDITDPLLWRLAIDVLAAHQPEHDGNCRNLQYAEQTGICTAASNARRALTLARTATRHQPRTPAGTPRSGTKTTNATQQGLHRLVHDTQASPGYRTA